MVRQGGAGSRTSGLRIMFRDCSHALCVMFLSQSSGLELDFQSLVPSSLPVCGHGFPAPLHARFPGQPVTAPGVAATVAPERAILLCATTRNPSILLIRQNRTLLAATPKFEVKRHGASGHSNDCMPVPPGGYSASNFAGSAEGLVVDIHGPAYRRQHAPAGGDTHEDDGVHAHLP